MNRTAVSAVIKTVEEQRFSLHVAYPALRPEMVKVGADGYRDIATPETVEQMAWGWMAKSRRIGLWHQDGTEGHGTLVESWIHRGPDWEIEAADGSMQVVKAGDWLVGIVWDHETWAAWKAGVFKGVSIQGNARRRPVDETALATS